MASQIRNFQLALFLGGRELHSSSSLAALALKNTKSDGSSGKLSTLHCLLDGSPPVPEKKTCCDINDRNIARVRYIPSTLTIFQVFVNKHVLRTQINIDI